MSLLSLTFHATDTVKEQWLEFMETDLHLMAENLMQVDGYFLSDIESDMIQEGHNSNLLLIFSDKELRDQFMVNELVNIQERITGRFGTEVMLFHSFINQKHSRF